MIVAFILLALAAAAITALAWRSHLSDQRLVRLLEEQRTAAMAAAEERSSLAHELQRRISRDLLTGLANRQAFMTTLRSELDRGGSLSVLFLDLDDFKTINDTLGHAVGDELIDAVAQRLLAGSRGNDLVARFGGDEFAVLLCDLPELTALRVAQRLVGELRTPFLLCGRTVTVRASGGLAPTHGPPPQGVDRRADDLLREADLAMYASKVERSHGVIVYHDAMQTDMHERLALESDMHQAIAGHDFALEYQPILDLRSRNVTGIEALMRWHHLTRGTVEPARFIPVAEQTGMIVPLTLWALREACAQLRRWDEDRATRGLSISVNISGRLVREPGIGSAIARELHRAAVDPSRLTLEITESLLMEDHKYAIQTLCQLRALGTRLSVDDFGTGYSSLSRLNTLPIDEVKIDRSFVSQLDRSETGRTIVTASISMAHGLGLRAVAEGIETERQLDELCAAGCDEGQGFLFSRPAPPDHLRGLLRELAIPGRRAAPLVALPEASTPSAASGAFG